MDHELNTLDQYIDEAKAKIESRRRLRQLNLVDNIKYPSETELNALDSSIKRNSAFVKRLKVFTESQKEQILNDINRLNLTKFISEVASSIIEAKIKLSDIPAVIEICTSLNRTYREFSKHLLDQYVKYFPSIKRKHDATALVQSGSNQISHLHTLSSNNATQTFSLVSKSTNKVANEVLPINPSKIRVDLRLFAELMVSGLFSLKDSFPVLMSLLYCLMIYDQHSHQNANAILTFCKGCGDEIYGLVPRRIKLIASKSGKEVPTSNLIPVKRQEVIRTYLRDYYFSLIKYFEGFQEDLSDLILKNKRLYNSKGEATKESKEQVDIKHSECQRFQNILHQLADLLDQDKPNFPDFEALKYEAKDNGLESESFEVGTSMRKNSSIWDDEGTRSFYEDLLDLKTLFPNLIAKTTSDSKKSDVPAKTKSLEDIEAEFADRELKSTGGDESRGSTPTKVREVSLDGLERTVESSSSLESLNVEETSPSKSSPLVMSQEIANRVQPDQYFSKLSNCVNRDMIDNAAIDFMQFFNTKFGRRKFVKTLFNVQRTRLDLLPFFARLTATIHRYVPSIGNELVSLLKQDFRKLFRKKDQINIESKVKNVRFIGELVKFNLYPKQEALNCLKMLLSDFTHHHIEMTCNLLETCGRLFFKSNDTHHQLQLLLEQMMRKKLLLSVDSKYVTMIENAYYFTNPPEVIKHVVEEPPTRVYVRYLLCECLNRSTIDKVLQKIKKLNWSDKELTKFVINCMIEAYNLKFYNIRYLAALLAALNKEHQWISVAVIDGVVEDILLMMEINELQFNQRRIPMMRYFGELYNYKLSDSSLVFKILYSLITYGVLYPEPEQTLAQIPMCRLDLPDNLFRIKLVCDLLETCGQYLSNGQDRKKLDCYLLFFQRYYWYKRHVYMLHPYCMAKSGNLFPASIEYQYNDAIFNLRPDFQMATSYSQAIREVQNFVDNLIVNQPS